MDVLREFLEFIESTRPETVEKLMHRVLLRCREPTGAEAGTIFIVRGRGRNRRICSRGWCWFVFWNFFCDRRWIC